MKRVILISPYFTPSSLACVLRTRLVASRLAEFGWEPTVVCVDPACYEEPRDEATLALLPDHLRIERVGAWPSAICRPLGFGDVSLRGQTALRRRVEELIGREKFDLIFCTVLPGYTMLVGAWARRQFRLPFVLDYQDPWVQSTAKPALLWTKAGLAHWLARKLEPGAVAQADALTAVSDATLDTLRERRLIRAGIPQEVIPIGADENDHAIAAQAGRSQIPRELGVFQLLYPGTLTDRMLPALRAVLLAAKTLAASGLKLRVHLIGTSAQPNGTDSLGVGRLVAEIGVSDLVRLEPRRIPYLDALRTMQDADALLLLGSTDSHYTASKIFPCWLAKKPILGLFHAASTVTQLAAELGGVSLVTYDEQAGAETRIEAVGAALRGIVERGLAGLPVRNLQAFEPHSARGVARAYASLFNRVTAA